MTVNNRIRFQKDNPSISFHLSLFSHLSEINLQAVRGKIPEIFSHFLLVIPCIIVLIEPF